MGIDRRPPAGRGIADNPLPGTSFLPDWLFFHAERTPGAPADASPTARLSYGELADRVRALAGHLAARGIGPGSRVLLALPNTPATVVAGLAVNALGGTSVEVNREWSAEVLGDIVTRSQVRQAFLWARDAPRWGAALAGRPIDHCWAVHPSTLPAAFRDALGGVPATLLLEDGRIDPDIRPAPVPPAPELELGQPVLVLYTSGSTGRPHGVIQTFRNVDANTRSIVQYLGITADDRALLTLPLYYCYGRSVLQTHLYVGGSVFLDNRMAFPRIVLETLASEGCTGFAGVPPTFEMIRRLVDVSTVGFPRLRYLTQAGRAMAPDTIAWVRAAFQPAKLFVMYGQTEATARLSYLPPRRALDRAGSIGTPFPASSCGWWTSRAASCRPARSESSSLRAPTSHPAISTNRLRRRPSCATAGSGPATWRIATPTASSRLPCPAHAVTPPCRRGRRSLAAAAGLHCGYAAPTLVRAHPRPAPAAPGCGASCLQPFRGSPDRTGHDDPADSARDIGAGGFGREVLDLVSETNGAAPTFDFLGFLGFLDDGESTLTSCSASGRPFSSRLPDLAASYLIGIGTAEPRRRMDALARSWVRTAATLTHPSATIGSDVQIGDGAVVAAGVRLTTHIVVGRHAHLNLNCMIGHDEIVEDFATLYPGVHLGGGCVIEEGATLGTGCVVLPNVRVGRGAVVGARAVVVRDVAPDTTVVGAVARPTLRIALRPGRDPIRMTSPVTEHDGWLRPHVLDLVGDVGAAVPMLCRGGG